MAAPLKNPLLTQDQPDLFAIAEHARGQAGKEQVMALFEQRRAELLERGREAVLAAYRERVARYGKGHPSAVVTVNDAHRVLDDLLPAGVSRNFLGAIFRTGDWARRGFVPSVKANANGRMVAAWALKADL